jgi:glycine/D-amino acid oxidase-like deaminating enzyme
MTVRADAVVVGAGVIGSAIALELSRGGRDVAVVDRLGGPGHGSTSASSAIVRFNYSTRAGVALSWESKHCWEIWPEHLGAPDGEPLARFHRTGLVMLDVDVAPKAPALALFDEVGVPYEVWLPDDLARRIPGIDVGRYWPPKRPADDAFWAPPDGALGAFFTPDAGYVDDPQLAAVNLMAAAARHGARLYPHREVTAVRRRGDRVTGIELDGVDHIEAPVVVNAAGPWSAALNRLAGADADADFTVSVRPLRQEVHHVSAPPGHGAGAVVADLDLGTYIRPAPGDALLVGGTEPDCDPLQWLGNPEEAAPDPSNEVFTAQVTRAARRLPGLVVPNRPRGIVGVYDVTDDWTPIYDRTRVDGLYVAIGTSGNQFKNAPVVGQLVAGLIDAVENGADHDTTPVEYVGPHTGLRIDLSAFSRRRPVNTASTHTVLG